MFAIVWRWAGQIRTTERNLGIDHWTIRQELNMLMDDARAWVESRSFPADEICVRVHRLVFIPCFANGNGRHARLYADLLARALGLGRSTWAPTTSSPQVKRASSTSRHSVSPTLATSAHAARACCPRAPWRGPPRGAICQPTRFCSSAAAGSPVRTASPYQVSMRRPGGFRADGSKVSRVPMIQARVVAGSITSSISNTDAAFVARPRLLYSSNSSS
jgi:hypothetical protein